MSVWTDISVKVEEGSKIVAEKARELSQIASLRAQIVACDNTLFKNYRELGKAYYEAHKDDLTPEFEEVMKIIADSNAKKEDLFAQLAEVKKTADVDLDIDDFEDDFDEVDEAASKAADAVEEAFDEVDEAVEEVTDSVAADEE